MMYARDRSLFAFAYLLLTTLAPGIATAMASTAATIMPMPSPRARRSHRPPRSRGSCSQPLPSPSGRPTLTSPGPLSRSST